MKLGSFLTLEGIEGAGKSTAIKFLAKCLHKHNIDYILTREPGGTLIAEKIRQIILNHHQESMYSDTELLLYFAGRAQHFNQVIMPAINRGQWIICDRFTDATYAYQGGGRGLTDERIAILEQWVQGNVRPNYTLLFDVAVTIGLGRIKKKRNLDRIEIEREHFFEKVRNYYLERASREPERFFIIDANKTLPEVFQQITKIIDQLSSYANNPTVA
ncbi:MAG: dTMP kinase [Coxiellaceae bacterium]|jgi:dTMP kinase|nr:dTMP kinase [Coxiellaceae bacterium]